MLMCNIIRAVYYSFSQDRLARLHGGTSTGEHGIGQSNRRYLVLEYDRAALGMVRAVKHAIDRDNIMNPGKVLPDS